MERIEQISPDECSSVTNALSSVSSKSKESYDSYCGALSNVVHLGFSPESDTSTVRSSLETLHMKVVTISELLYTTSSLLYVALSRVDIEVLQEEDKLAVKVENGEF